MLCLRVVALVTCEQTFWTASVPGAYSAPVGYLDQYAKETFALEVPAVTRGAAAWQLPPELNMSEVRLDGLFVIHAPSVLTTLAAPWSIIGQTGEPSVVSEVKMVGDHLDMIAVDRAVLRRQAWQVRRREAPNLRWDGETPLVMVAPHVPAVLAQRRSVERIASGCYRVGPSPFLFLWIAANELPLSDELIPFLIARSGRALDEFGLWVKTRRPPEWVTRMVECLPMTDAVYDELLRFGVTKTDDPVIEARKKRMVRVLLDTTPDVKEELREELRLEEKRTDLRRVLARRKLVVAREDDARIDACTDLATLTQWLDQAVDAPSAAEALR